VNISYAKTLVMANAKFIGRVVSDQLDFNPNITEFYKKVMKFSSTEIPQEIIETFIYSLNLPKALNTMNMSDLISNADQVLAFMLKTTTGENLTPTDKDNKIKDIVMNKASREMLPMLPWRMFDEVIEDSKLEYEKFKLENPDEATTEQ